MNWWRGTSRASVVARPAAPTDRPALAALLASSWRRHGVLAVEEQAALLGSGLSALALAGDDAVGFLGLSARAPACDPAERWADVAMLVIARGQSPNRITRLLLETASPALRGQGITGLVGLSADNWLRDTLAALSFTQVDQVLGYARASRRPPPAPAPAATLRSIGPEQADAVLNLNATAFAPLWRYDPATTMAWLLTADHAVLAEVDGRSVGFSLTTSLTDGEYAQLIRVATHPAVRGRGIGRQMVVDAILYAQASGVAGLALNTQASNTTSRHLYEGLGFREVGRPVAVMVRGT
jgi:ribosomal protein S18 acetylase RimI-like enzyme